MNDEIKEILDRLNNIPMGELYACCLEDSECKIILDYITNLQEENEKLKKENTKLYKKDTKIINELKEELEITQEKWNKDKQWSECRTKEWLDYKSRCEKATELIEKSRVKATPFFKQFDGDLIMPKREVDKLSNILNGGDE